ncbi:uncharacterized protein LOC142178301 [Nicotiana tabacum]|uniref:Uncharacterized protein LOC142178301 n=1 Tax=Nicotiana tabacum TaxID=4097 RepID=A0AC58U2N1_TOBAC
MTWHAKSDMLSFKVSMMTIPSYVSLQDCRIRNKQKGKNKMLSKDMIAKLMDKKKGLYCSTFIRPQSKEFRLLIKEAFASKYFSTKIIVSRLIFNKLQFTPPPLVLSRYQSKAHNLCLTACEKKIMGSNTVVGALFQEGTSQGNLPIPPKKDANGQVIVSTNPLDLDDYTDEQAAVITVNAKAKNLLYNAISGEEYEKISSCKTTKEMWDKLEVTYEGTNKVKETRINLLVQDYELFQMKDGESVEEMFSRFSKILGDLKSFGRPIKSDEQPKVIALDCQDLDKISYDELGGDLIAFEKTHLDRQIQEKKKTVAFKATVAEPENEEEEEGGEQDKNIAMLSQVVTSMMRKTRNRRRGKPNFRKGRISNEANKNDGRCYECEKFGHIQADCLELKKKLNRNMQKKKSFGAWSDEEKSDHEEIANMCFMAMNKNKDSGELGLMADNNDEEDDSRELGLMADEGIREVRTPLYSNCYELQEFVDIALTDIERVVNELRRIKRKKKDWALKLEVCEIERDMLQDEVNELQLQLNGLQKFTSHSSVKSNQTVHHKQKIHACSFCGKNDHSTNQCRNIIREERGLVTKLDRGTITFGDKSKGYVIGIGKVHLSSTCDVDEVYLVDELGYNLLSVSQLCDNDYEVRFKKHGWFIEDESGKIILSGNRDRNVYTISNLENLGDQICLTSMIDDP